MILDPHPASDQHQNVITSRRLPLPTPSKFSGHQSTSSWVILQADGQTYIMITMTTAYLHRGTQVIVWIRSCHMNQWHVAAYIQLSVKDDDFTAGRQHIIAAVRLQKPQEDEIVKLICNTTNNTITFKCNLSQQCHTITIVDLNSKT